jgi:ATP-dependent Clp protease ATP-binding subunit ClpX
LAMDDVTLEFDNETLDYIVDKSIEFKLGARGLRSIAEMIMVDYMYEIPSSNQHQLHIPLAIAKEKVEKSGKAHV